MSTLNVVRHGHVNHFTGNHTGTVSFLTDVLGARKFHEWETPPAGSTNALLTLGPVCIELFAPKDPEGAVGQYLARRPEGWHSLEWTVPDLARAVEVLTERGIRITEQDENYLFAHPRDLGGLSLEVTDHRFESLGSGDPRERPGWSVATGGAGRFEFAGLPEFVLASSDPVEHARLIADLVGRTVDRYDYPEINAVGAGVAFDDHHVVFVMPAAEVTAPAVGVWATVLPVGDPGAVAAALKGQTEVELSDPAGVWLAPQSNRGAVFAFRSARSS